MFQVVDGFFVKRVQDVKESAAYLTVMTRYLQKLYQVGLSQCSGKVQYCFVVMLHYSTFDSIFLC